MKILPKILINTGLFLLIFSFLIFLYIFLPIINVEINYNLNTLKTNSKQPTPIDTNFGIVIPKINANTKIVPNVDPYNSNTYQLALTKGVAHAKNTSFPNQEGNMFIFSHSSVNLIEANKYNSIFYLLSKMDKNDEVYIYYKNKKYTYKVTDKKIVNASDVSYLNNDSNGKSLTLMTCWPAGTNYKRLILIAEQR